MWYGFFSVSIAMYQGTKFTLIARTSKYCALSIKLKKSWLCGTGFLQHRGQRPPYMENCSENCACQAVVCIHIEPQNMCMQTHSTTCTIFTTMFPYRKVIAKIFSFYQQLCERALKRAQDILILWMISLLCVVNICRGETTTHGFFKKFCNYACSKL